MELITEPPNIPDNTTIPRWNGNTVLSPRNPRENLNTNRRIRSPSPIQKSSPPSNEIKTIGNIHDMQSIERTPVNLGSRVSVNLSPIKLEEINPIPGYPTPTIKLPTPPKASPIISQDPKTPQVNKEHIQNQEKPSQPRTTKKNRKPYIRPSQQPIPDYSNYSNLDQIKAWAVLEDRYTRIKRSLPDDYPVTMPNPEKETLSECHVRYNQLIENYQKNKFIDDETDKYRFYLVCFWAVIEVVLLLFGVTSANGYTNLQLMMASQYDFTLMELGEQRWDEIGGVSSSSPIYDILSSSIITMVIFIILKLLTSFLGEESSTKSTNFIMGKMMERHKAKEGSSLFGVGDIFGLLADLRNATSNTGESSGSGIFDLITRLVSATT